MDSPLFLSFHLNRTNRLQGILIVHFVLIFHGVDLLGPDLVESLCVGHGALHHLEAVIPLRIAVAGLAVEGHSILGEVSDHKIEDLFDEVIFHVKEGLGFEDQLSVNDHGKELAETEHKVGVLLLIGRGRRSHHKALESLDLFLEHINVRQVDGFIDRHEVLKLCLAEPLGRALVE